jgi:hypothetical protein
MATDFNKIDRAAAFNPISAFPLDARTYFSTLAEAQQKALTAQEVGSTDSEYYIGQTLIVCEENKATEYVIQPDKTLRLNTLHDITSGPNQLTVEKDLRVKGDLIVEGDSTKVNTEVEFVKVGEAFIEINSTQTNLASSGIQSGVIFHTGEIPEDADSDTKESYGIMYDPNDDAIKLGLVEFEENQWQFKDGEGEAIAVRALFTSLEAAQDAAKIAVEPGLQSQEKKYYVGQTLTVVNSTQGTAVNYIIQPNGTLALAMDDILPYSPGLRFTPVTGENSIKYGEGYTISGYSGNSSIIKIPAAYNGKPVLGIGGAAFASTNTTNSLNIRQIILPSSIKFIGYGAFAGCSYLREINLPYGLQTIGTGVFSDAISLKELVIPPTVIQLGENSFKFNTPDRYSCVLKKLSIPAHLTGGLLGTSSYTYSLLSAVENLEISVGASGTEIAARAFEAWTNLKSIEISEGITKIGTAAAKGCTKLEKVNLPNSLQIIENSAFYKCSALKTITFGEQLTEIGAAAFARSGLNTVILPPSVTTLGATHNPDSLDHADTDIGVFSNCASLANVILGAAITALPAFCFFQNYRLRNIILNPTLRTMGNYCFGGCTVLKTIELPATLTHIGSFAFASCMALRHIFIPKSVVNIGARAFRGCFGNDVTPDVCRIYVAASEEETATWSEGWNCCYESIVPGHGYDRYNTIYHVDPTDTTVDCCLRIGNATLTEESLIKLNRFLESITVEE